MSMVRELFITVCNMSVTAAFVIVMVLLARQLLKKVPRRFSYYLWLIVAFRLICPYSVPSGLSLFNLEFFQDRADAGNTVVWEFFDVLSDGTGEKTAVWADGTGGRETAVEGGQTYGAGAETAAESAEAGAKIAAGSVRAGAETATESTSIGAGAAVGSAETGARTAAGLTSTGVRAAAGSAEVDVKTATGSAGVGAETAAGPAGIGAKTAAESAGTGVETAAGATGTDAETAAGSTGTSAKTAAESAGTGVRTENSAAGTAELLAFIWLAGIAVFLLCQLTAYVRLRKKVETAVRFGEGIYECDAIHTPFVMGFFAPRIYLPFRMTEKEYAYILLHEQCHIRRRDHQVKVISVLILAVHWFNPFVWAAYHFMCKDMEMSCDEMVIGKLGNKVKEDYSRSLLEFAMKGRSFAAAPLAFGEIPVKTRIKNVLRFQSPKRTVVLFGIVICVAAAALGLGNGRKRSGLRYAGDRSVTAGGNQEVERRVSYDYELPKEVKSYLLYKEKYREGVLESYTPIALCGIDQEQKKGTITIGSELFFKNGSEDDSAFLFKLSDGTDEVMDSSSIFEDGYDAVAETYYMQNEKGWTEIEPGQDIVITAWNLASEKTEGVEARPCVEFMDQDLKWDALAKNDGVILYHLVFSEKSVQELEEEYRISPYVRELFAMKNPYIGDAPADGKLLKALAVAPELPRTTELKTDEEPYALILHFEDTPENETEFYHSMAQKATALLALIENASQIEWTYPAEGGGEAERHFCWNTEQAAGFLGVEDLRTIARDEMALQTFLEKDFRYGRPFYEALSETDQGTTAPNGEVFPYESTVIGKIPGEAYDSLYSVLSKEEKPDIMDVVTALQEGGSSETLYVKKEMCARTEKVRISEIGDSGIRQGYLAEDGKVYQYREVMTGRHPNAAVDSAYIVYFDEPGITFQDITDYFFSSDSAKAFRTDMYVTPLEDLTEGK